MEDGTPAEGLSTSYDDALVDDVVSSHPNDPTAPTSEGIESEAIETPPNDEPEDNVGNYSRANLAETLPATDVNSNDEVMNDNSEAAATPSLSEPLIVDEKAEDDDEDKDSTGLTVSDDEEADSDEDDKAAPAYREQLFQADNSVAAAPSFSSEDTRGVSEDRRGASVSRHGGRASKADALARLSAPSQPSFGGLQPGATKQRGWWGRTVSAVGGVLRGQGNAGTGDNDDDDSMTSRGSSSGRTSEAAESSRSGSSTNSGGGGGGAPVRLSARERRDALMAQRQERQQSEAASNNKSWSKPTQALPAAGEAEAEGEVGCAERHTFGKWMVALFEDNGDYRAVSTLKRVDGPVFWYRELRTGLLLSRLADYSQPTCKVMVPHLGPRSPAQRVENVFALLACLSGTKCSPMLASVRPPDVAAGEPQAILDLVWALASGSSCDSLGASDASALALLLSQRINARMPPYLGLRLPERRPEPARLDHSSNASLGSGLWTSSAAAAAAEDVGTGESLAQQQQQQHPFARARLADGRLLLAMAHSLAPETCPYAPHAGARYNAEAALQVLCGPPWNAPPIIDPDSFSESPRAFMLFAAALEAIIQEVSSNSSIYNSNTAQVDENGSEAVTDESFEAADEDGTEEASGNSNNSNNGAPVASQSPPKSPSAPDQEDVSLENAASSPLPSVASPVKNDNGSSSSSSSDSGNNNNGDGQASNAMLESALRELTIREAEQSAALSEAVGRVVALQTAAAEARDAAQTSQQRALAATAEAAAWQEKHAKGLEEVAAAEAKVRAMRETAASVEKGFLKSLEDARREAEKSHRKAAKAEQRWHNRNNKVDARVASLTDELKQMQKARDSALASAKKAERRVIGLGAEKSALTARVERLTAAVKEQARFLSEMQAHEDDESDSLAPGVAEYRAKQLENLGSAAAATTTALSPTASSLSVGGAPAASPLLSPAAKFTMAGEAAAEVQQEDSGSSNEIHQTPASESQSNDLAASPTTKSTSSPPPAATSSPTLSPRRMELSVSVGAASPTESAMLNASTSRQLSPALSSSSSPPPPPPVEPVTPRTPRSPRPEDSAAAAIAAIMAVVNEQEALEVKREASRARVPSNDDEDDDDDDEDAGSAHNNEQDYADTTLSASGGSNLRTNGEVAPSDNSSWKLAGPFTFVVGDRVLVRDDPSEEWRAGSVEAAEDDEDDDEEGPVVLVRVDGGQSAFEWEECRPAILPEGSMSAAVINQGSEHTLVSDDLDGSDNEHTKKSRNNTKDIVGDDEEERGEDANGSEEEEEDDDGEEEDDYDDNDDNKYAAERASASAAKAAAGVARKAKAALVAAKRKTELAEKRANKMEDKARAFENKVEKLKARLESGKEALELSAEATQAAQKEATAALAEKEKLAAALIKAENIAAHYKKEKRDLEAEFDEVSKASEELEKLQRAATERAEYADVVEAERNAAQELAFEAQDKASETEFRLLQQASATAQAQAEVAEARAEAAVAVAAQGRAEETAKQAREAADEASAQAHVMVAEAQAELAASQAELQAAAMSLESQAEKEAEAAMAKDLLDASIRAAEEETTAAKAAAAAAKQELEECVASAAATSATLKAACEARVEEAQAAVAEAQTREKEAREDLDRLRSCVDDQSKLIASMQAQQKALDEKAASGDSASEALVERCAALQHALNENQAKAAAKEEALAEAAHRAAVEHEAYARNCRAEAEAARTSAANTAAELAALTRERDSLAAAAVRDEVARAADKENAQVAVGAAKELTTAKEKELASCQAKLASLQKELSRLPAMVASLETRLSAAGKDKAALEAKLAEAEKKESQAAQAVEVLKAQLAAAANNNVTPGSAASSPSRSPQQNNHHHHSLEAQQSPTGRLSARERREQMEQQQRLGSSTPTEKQANRRQSIPTGGPDPNSLMEVHVAFVALGGAPGHPNGPMLCQPLRALCPKDHPISWLFSEALRHVQDENGTDSALEVVALRRPPKPTPLELDVDCGQVLRPGDVLEALCTMEESSTLSSGAPAGSKRLLTKIVSVLCVLSPDAFHGGQGPQSAAEERLVTHGFTVKCDSSMPVSSLLSAVLRRSGCPNRLQVSKLERLPNLDNEEDPDDEPLELDLEDEVGATLNSGDTVCAGP